MNEYAAFDLSFAHTVRAIGEGRARSARVLRCLGPGRHGMRLVELDSPEWL
jgi:hypothetical protein